MQCPKCMRENSSNASSCMYCGYDLKSDPYKIEKEELPMDESEVPSYKAKNNSEPLKEKMVFKEEKKEEPNNTPTPKKKSNALYYFCGILTFCFVIFMISVVFVFYNQSEGTIYFSSERNQQEQIGTTSTQKTQNSETTVTINTKYYNQIIEDEDSAKRLIQQDSLSEKKECSNKEIATIEKEIENLGILGVNLCELDVSLARELRDAFRYIYTEYPIAKKYLTNFTLYNSKDMNLGNNTLAFFIFHMDFAYSVDTYPYAAKTAIAINSSYFLNLDKLNRTLSYSSSVGHFPKNASRSSVVVHELAHYLSYIVSVNEYKKDGFTWISRQIAPTLQQYIYYENSLRTTTRGMIHEAYENYQAKYHDGISEDEFRASISKYAMSQNNKGEYLYDETIAEAFHDYYLNKDKAAPASIEIYKVLDKRLKELS